jgi:site-specific DNA-methyltransferase (adenine-specific)
MVASVAKAEKKAPANVDGAEARRAPVPDISPLDLGKPYEPIAVPVVHDEQKTALIPLGNQLYQGDCLDTLKSFADKTFHACVTDPPYNIAKNNKKGLSWAFSSHVTMHEEWDAYENDDYEAFTTAWLKEVSRTVKENGNIFIFGSYHNIYTIGAIATRLDLRIVNSIIWAKPNAQPNITCRMFTESTEQILWLVNNTSKKAKNWTFNYHHMKELNGGKQMRNYWEIPVTPMRERTHGKHPSQKPLKVMDRIILAGTNEGERVLDCFAGSGSTLLSCDRLERRWIGVERDPKYVEMAHARLDEERRQRRLVKVSP